MSDSELTARISDEAAIFPGERIRNSAALGGNLAVGTRALTKLFQWVFSFPALLGALLIGALATIARTFFLDPDVWWHLKQGAGILATHRVPTSDIYSFLLAGRSWTAYEWLGDVLLAATYRIGGLRGLEVLLIVLGGAILVALYVLAAIRCGNSKAAFVATAGLTALASVSFNLRPQMLGYLFFILTLIALERFQQGKRRGVWALPFLMVLWVNSHGSWVIGLGVIGVYLACGLVEFHIGGIKARHWSLSERLQLAIIFGLSACATLITPYGVKLAKYPFDVASSKPLGVANVVEWRPMPFNMAAGKVFLALLLGFIVAQIAYRFTWRLEEFTLLLFAVTVACLHIRFLLIFVPVFAMFLATILARWVPQYERSTDRHFLNVFFITLIFGLIVRFFPTQLELQRNVANTYPVGAVEYLDHHSVPIPMYNAYGFGGYLIWARGPEHKVFMDGRSELYEREGVLGDYLQIMNIRPDALSLLEKYGIRSCLLERDEPLGTVLSALPDWQRVYEDRVSILFVRRNIAPDSAPQRPGLETSQGSGL